MVTDLSSSPQQRGQSKTAMVPDFVLLKRSQQWPEGSSERPQMGMQDGDPTAPG